MSDQALVAKQEHVWDTIATLCTPFTEREWKTPTVGAQGISQAPWPSML
jgi:hypothetical protein